MRKFIILLYLLSFGVILIPIGLATLILTYPFDRKLVIMNLFSRVYAGLLVYGCHNTVFRIEGKENIEKGKTYIIISNHRSFFDIPQLQLLPINLRWVSKREVLQIPLLGWVLAMQGSITVKRGDKDSARSMMKKGKKLLQKGVSIVIFPEGTRSKTGKIGHFRAGGFLLAKSAGVDILPTMLYNSKEGIEGKIGKKVHLTLKILPPVDINSCSVKEMAKNFEEQYIEGTSKN